METKGWYHFRQRIAACFRQRTAVLLLGLQLRSILEALASQAPLSLLWDALLVCLAVIIIRIVWVIPAAFSRLLARYLGSREAAPAWRNVLILAWTGMRGGVSLAAALALPLTISGGAPFPERDLVIFLTFCVILATLVGQGLSLGPLIRLLHLQEDGSRERELDLEEQRLQVDL